MHSFERAKIDMTDKTQNPQQKQQLALLPGWLLSPSLRSARALGMAWHLARLKSQSRKPDSMGEVSANG